MIKAHFYDIESLSDVFLLCNYKEDINELDTYYIIDNDRLEQETYSPHFLTQLRDYVLEKNKNFNGKVNIFNLKNEKSNEHLAKELGVSDSNDIADPTLTSTFPADFRITCDTDENYDKELMPYFMGYNSNNYDTTMLAQYFQEVYPERPVYNEHNMLVKNEYGNTITKRRFEKTTAKLLREFNDELFSPEFKKSMPSRLTYNSMDTYGQRPNWADPRHLIRRNMLRTGRHIDVAQLNEKQRKVGLKRLLGNLGYQILESDKLGAHNNSVKTLDELFDLIAYCASDVINLAQLFHHPYYKGQFELKRGLIEKYPELIYNEKDNTYTANVNKSQVRRDRATINTTSAVLATMSLCPYGHLKDDPVVSFWYPSERKSKEENIPRVNVLEESKKFFYANFSQFPHIIEKFDKVYNYYKSIEGKNFNDSDYYRKDWGNTDQYREPDDIYKIPKNANNLFYYQKDGTPSSAFVTFSVGGIHGQEANVSLFEDDYKEWENATRILNEVKQIYPDPLDMRNAKKVTLSDGTEVKWNQVLVSGSTIKAMKSTPKEERHNLFYRTTDDAMPVLFKEKTDKSTELNSKYSYTSFDLVNHEDFESYYPNLLRMMEAFYNEGLGYDRYGEIFFEKAKFGRLAKQPDITKELKAFYNNQRNGTKLILNSASGAANATFDNVIKVSNKIIAMRIIGQLFTWRVGQAQTLRGAKITSTNTDGLYSVLEEQLNNQILEKVSKDIYVNIEPEPMYLISKDTNNRLEMDPNNGKVISSAGGSLACYKDTSPLSSLTHPAIIDWALGEYIIMASLSQKASMYDEFNKELGETIIKSSFDKFETPHLLRMYQNIISSSTGSMRYNFATHPNKPGEPIILQHYNRTFIMKDKTPNTIHIDAATAKKITPATIKKRKNNNERLRQHDDIALKVLSGNGVLLDDIPRENEAALQKVTNIEKDWYIYVQNQSLFALDDTEINFIKNNLDLDKYVSLLKDAFEKNWKNNVPKNFTSNDVRRKDIYVNV